MTTDGSRRELLIPPRIDPPVAPLPRWRFLPTFVRNPLRAIPRPVYHEPIYVPAAFGGRYAWVTDPALVERVLLHDAERFSKTAVERRLFEPIIGDGVLTAEGASWRWQRRTAAPLFRHAEIVSYAPAMAAAAEHTCTRWTTPGRRAIDADMTDVTFDVLRRTIFTGATDEETAALKRDIDVYLKASSWEIAYGVLQIPAWVWHPAKGRMGRAARGLRTTIDAIIVRERAKDWPSGGLMARLGAARDPETGAPMSDTLIADNLLTFAAAGHETTAKALTWTLYLLARAPHWQDAVRAEVRSVAGDASLGADHVARLTVTTQVVKEAMRLYPPAPVLTRVALQDIQLGPHYLRPGALVVAPIYVIHRHRKLWRNPDVFDPGRFSSENAASHLRTQFMPFGFGPRMCIGMSFAMIEATLLLATFIRAARFDWDGKHMPEPVSRVTLRPRGGMPLIVTPLSPV